MSRKPPVSEDKAKAVPVEKCGGDHVVSGYAIYSSREPQKRNPVMSTCGLGSVCQFGIGHKSVRGMALSK